MFQVKATLVEFLDDEQEYPCHFSHKIGTSAWAARTLSL